MKKKKKKKAPAILMLTGISLVGVSWLIDKFITSGFFLRVNSDTYGVGLALLIGGLVWIVWNFRA